MRESILIIILSQIGWGLEFQVYPTGLMPGLRFDFPISQQDEINVRIGANLFDHQDFGVQEDERGAGFGGTLGYRHYFKDKPNSLFLGARTDIWRSNNNWRSEIGTPMETSGTSRILVVQPTVEAGYNFALGEKWALAPSAAFGLEWNVITNGREVGQGPILLLGVSFMRQRPRR